MLCVEAGSFNAIPVRFHLRCYSDAIEGEYYLLYHAMCLLSAVVI